MGNSPRIDIINDFNLLLNDYMVKFIEIGVLDKLSEKDLPNLLTTKKNEKTIITKYRDNITCYLKKDEVGKIIENLIHKIDPRKFNKIVIACDEDYRNILGKMDNIVLPLEIMKQYLESQSLKTNNSIVFPTESQVKFEREEWCRILSSPQFLVCDPFSTENFVSTIKSLKKSKPDRIILNCFGFTLEQKRSLEHELGIPVILPRELVARHIKQDLAV